MSSEQFLPKTDIKLSVKQTFGFESDMQVGAFSKKNEYVPKIDPDYKFDALNLVKDLMRGQRYAAFESTQLYNSSERINIRGSGETTTSRLY